MDYGLIYNHILNIPPGVALRPTGKKSHGSMAFVCKPFCRRETLKHIFGIDDNDTWFDEAFRQVTAGKGMEIRRIMTLHSSSMLGLLIFHSVESHPVIVAGVRYVRAFFEVESRVFDSNSSVDVMLVSEDGNTLLFLELKFTEFLSPSAYYRITGKYHNLYSSMGDILSESNIRVGDIEKRKKRNGESAVEFKISGYDGVPQYFCGVKQLISHAIGLMQAPLSGNKTLYDRYIRNRNPKIILGTMLYDSSGLHAALKSYCQSYSNLYISIFSKSTRIKECIRTSFNLYDYTDIEIFDRPLTYQADISGSDGCMPFLPKVKSFYRL